MSLFDLFRRPPTIERLANELVAAAAAAGETGWRFEANARRLVREGTDGVLHLQPPQAVGEFARRVDRERLLQHDPCEPGARVMIIPGATHVSLVFEKSALWLPMIAEFLAAPMPEAG